MPPVKLTALLFSVIKMSHAKDKRKKIIYLMRTSPYGNSHANEAIDLIIAAATVDQIVSVIFLDDGVWQLKNQQNPQLLQVKSYTTSFKMLSLYGDVKIMVEEESLIERHLHTQDLLIPVILVYRNAIKELIAQQDIVFNF